MAGRLDGKVALISGSARGMGAVEAELFTQEGATVIVSDILDDLGEEMAKTLKTDYLHLDVTSREDWAKAAAFVEKKHGRLDILVNNAGTVAPGLQRFDELTLQDHHRLFDVNVHGAFYGMRAMLPLLKKGTKASIINIASLDSLAGVRWHASFVASKHALMGLSRSIAIELGPLNIRVNSIHPGIIDTPLLRSHGDARLDRLNQIVSRQPLPRKAKPIEVANVALFLASDEASYVTGSEYRVDAGHLTGPYREDPV